MILSDLVAHRQLGVLIAAILALPLLAAPSRAGLLDDFKLTLHDLDPKVMPIEAEDDGNLADVAIRHRMKFKPGVGMGAGLERRTRMKAGKDGGSAAQVLQVPTATRFTSLVVAVDSDAGLVHGHSRAFLERRPSNGLALLRIEATWNVQIAGLTARAFLDGQQIGSNFDLPGERQATLSMVAVGGSVVLEAAGAATCMTFVPEDMPPWEADPVHWAWGCDELGPQGAFWFANLHFEWNGSLLFGALENAALDMCKIAWQELGEAADELGTPPPSASSLQQAAEDLFYAGVTLGQEGVMGLLQDAAGGTPLPTTDVASALSLAESAKHWADSGVTVLGKLLQAGKTKGGTALGRVHKAQGRMELLVARLAGFKSKSLARLEKSAELIAE